MSTATASISTTAARPRAIVQRTRGNRHGPITRLMSPGDLGQLLKPFVFLDLFEAEQVNGPGFAPHPHSGIATVTLFLDGSMTYADSTGKAGKLTEGAVEWMRAGAGVWHAGEPSQGEPMRGYQLWLALPPELELAPAESHYLEPGRIAQSGPARIILGSYGGQTSPIVLPASLRYLHVRLRDGEHWTYRPDEDHDIAWLALNRGRLHVADTVLEREIAVFEQGPSPIDVIAEGNVEFVIGSSVSHPHPLVTGHYSVHSSKEALAQGEATIAALWDTPAVEALHAP